MTALTIGLANEAATRALGAALAPLLAAGDVVALSGPLGAGKTALARAAIAHLTGEADAPSPTFGLATVYAAPLFALWHFDLFRLARGGDVWELGLEEALDGGVALIEWAERIEGLLPAHTLVVRLTPEGTGRRARLNGGGDWTARLARLNPAAIAGIA